MNIRSSTFTKGTCLSAGRCLEDNRGSTHGEMPLRVSRNSIRSEIPHFPQTQHDQGGGASTGAKLPLRITSQLGDVCLISRTGEYGPDQNPRYASARYDRDSVIHLGAGIRRVQVKRPL